MKLFRTKYRITQVSPNTFIIEANWGIRSLYTWGLARGAYSSVEKAEAQVQAWLNPYKKHVVKTFPLT